MWNGATEPRLTGEARTMGGRPWPALGQGTWHMGASRASRAREVDALRLGISLGLTLIDTAEFYAAGGAEEVVGEAVRDCRERVTLVGKIWPSHATRQGVLASVRRSLERLGTDHLDVVLLHWPTREVPLAQTLEAMAEAQALGLIGRLGVSNFDLPWLEALERTPHGGAVCVNQVRYSLLDRRSERRVLPWARCHGQIVMAYTPLGHGHLERWPGHAALARVAAERGADPSQVALAYLISRGGVVPVPKAVHPDHVRSNAGAATVRLAPQEIERLEEAFPLPRAVALATLPPYGPFFRLALAAVGWERHLHR